jgi:hypothetical protein
MTNLTVMITFRVCSVESSLRPYKNKALPMITYESYHEDFWGTGGKIQHILNFMTIWERVVSFTPRRLYVQETRSDILWAETWVGSAMDVDNLE